MSETKSSASISTVISLLSALCRGSPAITHVSFNFLIISLFASMHSLLGLSSQRFPQVFFLLVCFLIFDLLYFQDLLRSDLPEAIEKALHGDERYIQKFIFANLVLGVLFSWSV